MVNLVDDLLDGRDDHLGLLDIRTDVHGHRTTFAVEKEHPLGAHFQHLGVVVFTGHQTLRGHCQLAKRLILNDCI